MGRYNTHPAQGGGHYHDIKLYKHRGRSLEQFQEQKLLKKLKKNAKRGDSMTIYEARGFQSNLVYPFDKMEPFQYIERFKPLVVPESADPEEYKRTQAPYCLSGKVMPEKNGSYKRNNSSLIYRDLIFLDYDDIQGTTEDFIEAVSSAANKGELLDGAKAFYNQVQEESKRLAVLMNSDLESYKETLKEVGGYV
ncbi:phage protein [Streptococcus pneumoniae]|nr:phage protein [Streptococcus pneumoniae]